MTADQLVYVLAISNGLMLALGAWIGYRDATGWRKSSRQPKGPRRALVEQDAGQESATERAPKWE